MQENVIVNIKFEPSLLPILPFFQDPEEPEGDVEGENGNSGDEEVTAANAQQSSPRRESRDQSPPITGQIPPLDNNDTTVENDTEPGETSKLLNEESDWAPSVLVPS